MVSFYFCEVFNLYLFDIKESLELTMQYCQRFSLVLKHFHFFQASTYQRKNYRVSQMSYEVQVCSSVENAPEDTLGYVHIYVTFILHFSVLNSFVSSVLRVTIYLIKFLWFLNLANYCGCSLK